MALAKKIIIFLVIFSFVFYFVRTNDEYNTRILLADLGGIPTLFGAVSAIFSILAAFVIQKEWDMWNDLADAVSGEVDGLEKLYLWSNHFPPKIKSAFRNDIAKYTQLVIKSWEYTERGEKSSDVENALDALNEDVYRVLAGAPSLISITFAIFSNVIQHRSERVQYSVRHMPRILKNTLQYAAFLLIFLSMFVGVHNIWLAFLFTASIASLAFAIFLVLLDLDNPLKPGSWHITTKEYENLLVKITSGESSEIKAVA